MGTTCFGCGCSISTSMFQIGEFERPTISVHHCLKHTINPIQQKLLVRMASELAKLIAEEQAIKGELPDDRSGSLES